MAATFLAVRNMTTAELRAWIEARIPKIKDDFARENVEMYLEAFYSDWASLAELACDIRDGLYK